MPLAGLLLAHAVLTSAIGAEEADFAAAEAEYILGNYARAVVIGRTLENADGLALAARAELVISLDAPVATRDSHIAAALGDALAALALSPNHVEAHLQAAIAYGYRGKLARSIRDARRGRRHIDAAVAEDPDSAWAAASLAGWHSEVVLEAGSIVARLLFGARRSKAIENFQGAIALDPENVAIRVSFGTTLLRFDKFEYETRAMAMLRAGLTYEARSALDTMLQEQARDLIAAFEAGDRDELKKVLDRTSPFSDD